MALTHLTPVFSIDEAAIYPMLTDVALSAPTYGAKVALPGIDGISIDPDVLAKELYGDNGVIGRAAKVRQIMAALLYAKLSLDVLPITTGGTTTDAGTTPNQTSSFGLLRTGNIGYFKVEFRLLGVEVPGPAGGGSLNVKLNKCKPTDVKPQFAPEDYGKQALNIAAIYPTGTANIIDIILNETAAALSA